MKHINAEPGGQVRHWHPLLYQRRVKLSHNIGRRLFARENRRKIEIGKGRKRRSKFLAEFTSAFYLGDSRLIIKSVIAARILKP